MATLLARAGRNWNNVHIGKWYFETAKAYPATTGIVTTILKTSAADLFAQKVLEKRDQVDWRRNGVFCSFGFAYLGCWQYVLYNRIFTSWTPYITSLVGRPGNAVVLTFLDQFIHHPAMYFPVFYLFKGGMEGRPVASSLQQCRADLWDNCRALWMIWVPAQLINFALVPLHMRIPFVAAVSFAWTVVLSGLRGALNNHGEGMQHIKQAACSAAKVAGVCTACTAAVCTCTIAAA